MALPVVKKEFSIPGGSSKKQNVEPNSKTEVNQALADKFNKLAEGLQSKIDNCFADRLTNTPRRLKQANQARNEGEKLDRTQKALLALSKLHAAGNVPNELKSIKSKPKNKKRLRIYKLKLKTCGLQILAVTFQRMKM